MGQSAHPHAVCGPGGGDRDPCRRARAAGRRPGALYSLFHQIGRPFPRSSTGLLQRRQATQSAVAQGPRQTHAQGRPRLSGGPVPQAGPRQRMSACNGVHRWPSHSGLEGPAYLTRTRLVRAFEFETD